MSIITIVGFEIPDRNSGAGMRTKDQGTLDKILKFVNKYYQENRVAPTISEVAAGVGVARSTTHRYIQELSDRDLLDYGRGILSAPESAKMKTAYIAAPLVGSIYCGSPEEEEENVEEYVSLGHQDISTTMNIYADVTKELREKELGNLEAYFAKQKG